MKLKEEKEAAEKVLKIKQLENKAKIDINCEEISQDYIERAMLETILEMRDSIMKVEAFLKMCIFKKKMEKKQKRIMERKLKMQ